MEHIFNLTVLQEPFNDDGTWRQDVFYNVTGEAFVPTALQAARAADPNAKLYVSRSSFGLAVTLLTLLTDKRL